MKTPSIADDFGVTADHDLLRKTARRFLQEKCPLTEVRRLVDDPRGFDPALYREMADLGWVGLGVDDAHGGAGMDSLALALLLEETGRCLLPAPLSSSILAATALTRAGTDAAHRLLPALADGSRIGTVALTEPGGSWNPADVATSARRDGDDWRLDGDKTHVAWAADADVIIAAARDGADLGLFAVDRAADGVTVAPEIGVDSTRRGARVTFAGAPATRLDAGDGAAAWADILLRGAALLAAEMVGAAQAILERTRDYAIERVQFGRPIGSFQAVKHPIVDVMIATEKARSLAYGAAAALDTAPESAEQLARAAKAAAEEALSYAADRGVQLHGGFGFTWDCDAHFYMKRALWSAATLGDARHHRRRLAEVLLG